MRIAALLTTLIVLTGSALNAEDAKKERKSEKGFKQIWDGKTFEGWKASENKDTWKIKDGTLVCNGDRSHLFFMADEEPFVNFELRVDVMTKEHSNAGIYFHTKYQETGWPKYGFEAQVNNTYKDPKKTGSLYGVVDVKKSPVKDNEWWTQTIRVEGKHVVIKINDKVVVDYTEPKDQKPFSKGFTRLLDKGTFCLQGHDPKSTVYFKNIRVQRLP